MSLFCSDAFVSPLEIEAAVTRALREDLGRAGDVTSIATIPEDTTGRAVVVASLASSRVCRWSKRRSAASRRRSR
jgi:nicotinate-nucleotide pyrophosphorylase (carboxylating)